MGWLRSVLRLLSFRRSGSDNSVPSGCPAATGAAQEQQQRNAGEAEAAAEAEADGKEGRKHKRGFSCLFSCEGLTREAMAARSGANERQLAAERAAGGVRRRANASWRNRKRVRKDGSTELDSPAGLENDIGSRAVSKCELCEGSTGTDAFVTGCSHTYCRYCLQEHLKRLVNSHMAVTRPTFDDLLAQLHCPNRSCQEELSRVEVVDLIGLNTVNLYERWFVDVCDKLYQPSVMKSKIPCTNETCAQHSTPTVVLASKVADLTLTEVRHALEVRGAERKCLKQSCVAELLRSVGVQKRDASKVVWLCTTCDAAWCAACGSHLPAKTSNRSSVTKMHRHCKGKQRYDIYKSLVELSDAFKVYTQGRESPARRDSKASTAAAAADAGAGKTIWADGTGFGGDGVESKKHPENMQAAAKKVESELDSQVEKQLVFLTDVLKGSARNEQGRGPSLTVATCALIGWENVLSRLLQQLATNDSMLDISERGSLYLKMVSMLGAIQLHSELRHVLSGCPEQDKLSNKESQGSQVSALASTESRNNFTPSENNNTLIGKMGNIYRQAKVMLQNMQQVDTRSADVDTSLARAICKCYENLQGVIVKQEVPGAAPIEACQSHGVSTRSKAKKLEYEKEVAKLGLDATKYKESLSKLQFRQVSMTDVKGEYNHYYRAHIMGKVGNSSCIDKRGAHNHKRMIHLSKEIASLATTLPLEWESSIHLCVDEHRMDVLRALIIGPHGTPYQNGLFFFDIFLPPDYPQTPPFVHFLTTGGGKVRFNPNLYDSGKICLSLLGTWSGPSWVPGKSTLLQVLVSIQSLIFVKDPYYNEPGFEQTKSPEAEKENCRYREHSLSLAVLAALRKPDPLFRDIAREHFRFKQKEVEIQCDEWVAATPETYSRQRIANIARDVKAELVNLSLT